jgi:hypothetical protein
MDRGFVKYVLIASFVTILLAIYPIYKYTTQVQIYSIITGFLISLANVFAGYLLIGLGLNKAFKTFMVVIFGGMIARMFVILALMLLLLYALKLDSTMLISSLIFYYFLFTTIEIYFINKKQQIKQKV